ncbi:MAG: tetratricopeptide repeat protein [Lentisphaeria bacterium]
MSNPVNIKKLSEAGTSVKRMVERAEKATDQKNYGYAFEILRNVLLAEPGLTEARMKLREAQLEKAGDKANPVRQVLATITTAWPIFVKGPMELKKGNYAQALDTAEKAMDTDPTVLSTLTFLKNAAMKAELTTVALNAMEIAAKFHPKNRRSLKNLAQLYQKEGQAGKSIQVLQKLQSLDPNSLDVQAQLKHATALAAMEDAQWEKADSFRDVVKDNQGAQTQEDQERVAARDVESRKKLIQSLREKTEQGNATGGDYRKLAELYSQNQQYDEAIAAYQKISEVTGTIDPGIESAVTDTMRDKYDQQISDLKTKLEDNPDQEEEIQKQIKKIEEERDAVLLERLQKRVRNYPNEMEYRLELGLAYWNRGEIDAALNEFQHAQRNPQFAVKSRLYMAKCLMAKGLTDIAIERLQENVKDKDRIGPALIKETMYELAAAYEKSDDTDNALTTWKELYNQDVNYRDVAQRLEAYYQKAEAEK